jgi:hypothetical protein
VLGGNSRSQCAVFRARYDWGLAGRHRARDNKLYDSTSHSSQAYTVVLESGSGNKASGSVVYAPNKSGPTEAVHGDYTCTKTKASARPRKTRGASSRPRRPAGDDNQSPPALVTEW